jgi:hypothetical protein
MTDQIKPNLEPIEDSDLNLKEKFLGGKGKNEAPAKDAGPEIKAEATPEKKEGMAEKESAYAKILSKVSAQKPPVLTSEVPADAEAANAGIDAESKINNLVQLAETKGIPHAVKVARHMEDNYTLDEFHDRLLGEELHSALVKRGMIKEI